MARTILVNGGSRSGKSSYAQQLAEGIPGQRAFVATCPPIDEELRDIDPITQFTRAMKELNIEVITANSPQAKGRVERGFGTHQDRLVKELRLAGISTMEAANKFLWEVYIPNHNARFAVEPANHTDAHRPLLKVHRLEEILSLRTERTVFNDFTVRFQNRFLQVLPDQPVRVRPKTKVMIEIRLDGSTHLRFKDRYLTFKPITKRPYRPFYAASKQRLATVRRKPCMPGKNHPWRRFSTIFTTRKQNNGSQQLHRL